MKNLNQHLSQYAAYHRDRRNIATHFIGIPIIVFAVIILLSRPLIPVAGIPLTPALPVALLATLFYLRLDIRFGLIMGALLSLGIWGATFTYGYSFGGWPGLGAGLFAIGWIIQFIGHYFEGRKPAFVDDITGLIVGPLFVVAELAFMLGMRKEVEKAVIDQVGPTLIRQINPAQQ